MWHKAALWLVYTAYHKHTCVVSRPYSAALTFPPRGVTRTSCYHFEYDLHLMNFSSQLNHESIYTKPPGPHIKFTLQQNCTDMILPLPTLQCCFDLLCQVLLFTVLQQFNHYVPRGWLPPSSLQPCLEHLCTASCRTIHSLVCFN